MANVSVFAVAVEFVLWLVCLGCSVGMSDGASVHPSSTTTPCLDSNDTMTFHQILKT